MDCVYCECGWTCKDKQIGTPLPAVAEIVQAMQEKLFELHQKRVKLDSLTFSGNGEPTLHPHFEEITLTLIELRNRYFPDTPISCLSNATQLRRQSVANALKAIERPMLKLDAGTQDMFEKINRPYGKQTLDEICRHLKDFRTDLCIQTILLRGFLDDGTFIDNTTEYELEAWIKRMQYIHPLRVELYRLDRIPPAQNLEKLEISHLVGISKRLDKIIPDIRIY
ncbi:MAG: radical SAM protein [Bacteroidales bacterium]|nr:radical SAM protein [Bacteroidales bacterium]